MTCGNEKRAMSRCFQPQPYLSLLLIEFVDFLWLIETVLAGGAHAPITLNAFCHVPTFGPSVPSISYQVNWPASPTVKWDRQVEQNVPM